MRIAIVASSTRQGRVSHRIALALESYVAERGHVVDLIDLRDVELDAFVERYGRVDPMPATWPSVMAALSFAHAMIWVTPEYNGSVAPGLVNLVSVFGKEPFVGKPIAVASGSTGIRGGSRASAMAQRMILNTRAIPLPTTLQVGRMHKKLAANGEILDDALADEIAAFADALLEAAERLA